LNKHPRDTETSINDNRVSSYAQESFLQLTNCWSDCDQRYRSGSPYSNWTCQCIPRFRYF